MAKIGLIAQGGPGWMGGTEYIRNLLHALAAAGSAEPTLFCFADAADRWRDCDAKLAPVPPLLDLPLVDRLGINNRHFARTLREHSVDFLYPLTYGNREYIGLTFPLRRTLRDTAWAGWIPDFQHRHLPHFFTPRQITFRDAGIRDLLREAKTLVLSSDAAEVDLHTFFPGFGGRVEVLRFGTCPRADWYEPFTDVDPAWPERFLLVCNQFWAHKNHATVFAALRILHSRGVRPTVLCTGALDDGRDLDCAAKVRAALAQDGLADQVHLLGLIPRRAQIELLRRCAAVIQPSLFEGWSTVVEDARVFEKPLLLSSIAVHREQDPPGARFFDPENAEQLADVIARAWEELPHGIDATAEARGRAAAQDRLRQIGKHLLEIAGGAAS